MERNQGPMKHQMERMWDSKNDAAADANITRSLKAILPLKNQFGLFRTLQPRQQLRRQRGEGHCQDEVVAERGQTNRSSGGQRPTLLDRRGHEEVGLA